MLQSELGKSQTDQHVTENDEHGATILTCYGAVLKMYRMTQNEDERGKKAGESQSSPPACRQQPQLHYCETAVVVCWSGPSAHHRLCTSSSPYVWLDKPEDLSISWCVLKNLSEDKTSAHLRQNKVEQVLVSLPTHRPAPVGAPSTDLLRPLSVRKSSRDLLFRLKQQVLTGA